MRHLANKLFRFDGRATRLEYWLLTLFPFIWTIGGFLIVEAFPRLPLVDFLKAMLWLSFSVVSTVSITGLITVAARRAHDRAKPAWFALLLYLIPMWGIIELGFLRGTRGPNTYGPDPSEPAAPSSV